MGLCLWISSRCIWFRIICIWWVESLSFNGPDWGPLPIDKKDTVRPRTCACIVSHPVGRWRGRCSSMIGIKPSYLRICAGWVCFLSSTLYLAWHRYSPWISFNTSMKKWSYISITVQDGALVRLTCWHMKRSKVCQSAFQFECERMLMFSACTAYTR